jgi:THO complex subunit 1
MQNSIRLSRIQKRAYYKSKESPRWKTRLTRQKHFDKRKFIILRSCNELLRRLSRAEDTVFCGRVFIFLFQTFPLGDKSSVNLRGEYHTDNKTTYDAITKADEEMVDIENEADTIDEKPTKSKDQTTGEWSRENGVLDMDTLYPIFWSLQQTFSEPTKLFESTTFESFRNGLKVTMQKFEVIQKSQAGRGISRSSKDIKGTKRKRSQEDSANAFNPKYLTSRDLFDLEV